MNSMENFFNWISKPIPDDELIIWLNIHNMNYEKIELYGDIFKSLNHVIIDTYMGDTDENTETKISLTQEDKDSHFMWCWNKVVEDFRKENIKIKESGDHKEYFKSFFMDTFYKRPVGHLIPATSRLKVHREESLAMNLRRSGHQTFSTWVKSYAELRFLRR